MNRKTIILALIICMILISGVVSNQKLRNEIEVLEARKEELLFKKMHLTEMLESTRRINKDLNDSLVYQKAYTESLQGDILDLQREVESLRTVRMKLTAYSPYDNKSGMEGGTKTSTGKNTCRYYCAADPAKIPYGTLLSVPDYGVVEVQDTGSALKKYGGIQLDLFHDTYAETVNFGVQFRDVMIVRWGKEDD